MRGIPTPTVRDGEYGFLQWPECELGCRVPVPSRNSSSTQPDASTKAQTAGTKHPLLDAQRGERS
jgi:hypothetical protein